MKKKYWTLLILLLTVLGGSGYMVFKQHTEKEKRIAIAHSDEAKEVYEEQLKKLDRNALTENGKIKEYQIDDSSLKYNPMGGMNLKLIINDNKKLDISFGLVKNESGNLETFGYTISPQLVELTE
ncbi:DUF1310 family protein [Streptococcus agalactiae]|uniref:DUF1310 family protein n=7 Tax=Streptococcus agalactiae TaxID=1311 RepID=UPI0002643158|nr:DUF1310 family protein [Streptococcus agalactiae]AFS46616.1 hypothetical protein A964_1861 [Streptococcus agalactiae GD201008-001]AKT96936.1 hypothetical protein SAHN016_09515 [Streptococcus agalactiae]AKT98869.1 hypothetical protein YM001_09420 [Streptococcus agalactiae]AKU00810.1 hypothetical protein GX064_09435 [Streptococcus agalactiae]AZL56806.1 DUF1310 family protein [Streptococcus agalactiae]